MAKRRKKAPKAGKRRARNGPSFTPEFRLKVARLYVEDSHPAKLNASQFGISDYSVYRWGKNIASMANKGWWISRKQRPDTSCQKQ